MGVMLRAMVAFYEVYNCFGQVALTQSFVVFLFVCLFYFVFWGFFNLKMELLL